MSPINHDGMGAGRPSQPDLNWAIATDFVFLRPGEWLPLLVEFDAKASLQESPMARWNWFVNRAWLPSHFKDELLVPALFRELPPALLRKEFPYCVVLLRREAARAMVEGQDWNATIRRAELGPPTDAEAVKPGEPLSLMQAVDAPVKRVLMGVIDQGIAFSHSRFRHKTGTRIEAVWRQDKVPSDVPQPGGPIPPSTEPGIVIHATDIDTALAAAGGDEAATYRAIGGLDLSLDGYKPLARNRTHGTLVLDLMAGADPHEDIRNRPIVAVDMPEHAVGDPSCSLLTAHALWGLLFVMQQAAHLRQSNETLPVVVNLSYGPTEGPHDGRSIFEECADHFVQEYQNSATPLALVVAAGNSRQGRMHARDTIMHEQCLRLHWRVQPGGRSPSAMHIWLEQGAQATVRLVSPTGQFVEVSLQKPQDPLPPSPGPAPLPLFSADYSVSPSGRALIALYIAPTEFDPGNPAAQLIAPSGIWKVHVAAPEDASTRFEVNAWIRRSDTPSGRRAKGRQSYFDEKSYNRFYPDGMPADIDIGPASKVTRANSLSGIATGKETFVIGGYRRLDRYPAPYSSQGPQGNAARGHDAPDWAAPSDDSMACRGVLSAGNLSNSVALINGTSAAAPQAARQLADHWASKNVRPTPISQPGGALLSVIQKPMKPIPPAKLKWFIGSGLLRGVPQKRPRP